MPASTRSRRSTDDADMPNKRRKVEPAEDVENALRDESLGERSEEFWFEDGSIILAAQGMSFRVHKGVLALRSDVFKTLLDDPSLEQLEGCPVLRVEDRGRDLRDLLHIMYNGGKSDWLSSSRPPIQYSAFRRVVDIALKYNIEEVLSEARYKLSRVFPTDSVENWHNGLRADDDDTPLVLCHADCIDLVRITRLLAMNSILPLVLYACCNIRPLGRFAHGVTLEGVSDPVTLAPNDLGLCLRGLNRLMLESGRLMRVFQDLAFSSRARSDQCATLAQCRQALQLLSLAAVDGGLYSDPSAIDFMDSWLDQQEKKPNAKPCQHCDTVLRDLINERREQTWCKLGKIFEVAEWPAGQKKPADEPVADAPAAA
ncbi:hypothetical protein PsYK624_060050 [Phanerochaete sordida]|uniref:BTB domain-containing protein n=1 Tax=Phanerochaete sordida TaxID=48140 RepID=A0A9P3LD28_9APHY|nr:hypothetical protein PsYK624_060050 [Phanerochaete sordida]